MPAARPPLVYHVAPAEVRASIRAHGIDPARFVAVAGHGLFAGFTPTATGGFFCFDSLDAARWYAGVMANMEPAGAMDIWAIAPRGSLTPDDGLWSGQVEEDESSAWFHAGLARPEALVETREA